MVKMRSAEVMCTHIFAGVFTHRYQPLRLQQLPHELPLQETLRVHQDSGRAAHGVFCERLSRAQCTHQGQAFSILCALSLDSVHLFSAAAAANDTDLDTLVLHV